MIILVDNLFKDLVLWKPLYNTEQPGTQRPRGVGWGGSEKVKRRRSIEREI